MKKMKIINYCILLGMAFIICSCAAEQKTIKPVTLERISQKQTSAEEDVVAAQKRPEYEDLKLPVFRKTMSEKKLPVREPINPQRFNLANTPVMISVEKMPLADFIIHALGETLKVAFVMDEATMNNKQPVTMLMPQAVAPDQALGIVLGVLEKNGLYVEETAGTLYILQKAPESKSPVDIKIGRDIFDSTVDIIQAVPLKHIRLSDIDSLIRDITKTGVKISLYPKDNVALFYGRAFQIRQIIDVINIFDVPTLQNKSMFLMRLTYWQIDDFISEIKKILTGLGFNIALGQNQPGPIFIPIKTLSSILVISPDEKTSKYILEWKERLDTAEAAGSTERSYSYKPQYTKASDLVLSIQKLYGAGIATSKAAPTSGVSTPSAPGVVLSDMKIAADDNSNVIVIMALPERYKVILNLLKAIDVPAKQVLIEATIAELTLTDDMKYGVEWLIRDTQQGGQYALGTLGKLGLGSLGLSYSFVSQTANLQAMVSALASANRAKILSTPRLLVLDNKDATIQVGQDVPTVTSEISTTTTTTATPSVLRSISYRSTGVMLKVKPTINTEGLVTLDINQEVSETGAPGVGDSPIILTRRITTSITVGHGQTVALGGLFKDNESLAETKVPLLGDLPLIGHLFKYTAKKKEKTELLVFVTPTILTTTDDAVKVTDELKKELKGFKFDK